MRLHKVAAAFFLVIGVDTFTYAKTASRSPCDINTSQLQKKLQTLRSINQSTSCEIQQTEDQKIKCDIGNDHKKNKLRFFSKDWHLQSIGADLVEKEDLLKNIDHSKSLTAIIDTGLTANLNPDAGKKLTQSNSKNFDEGQHGTHVAGIIASEKYGVNNRVPVKSFQMQNFWGSFSTDSLLKAIEAATKDPEVKVINLSLSSQENEAIQRAVKNASLAGKWIVYAAGNDGSVNNRSTTGLTSMALIPSVFIVGALSPFGPTSFSNYKPDTTVFAPGYDIESLDSHYSPNIVDSKPSIIMSGTSMATPVVSSVLATLRSIDPTLSPEEAKLLLDKISIKIGSKPTFPRLNYYLAVHALLQSKYCKAKNQNQLSKECIDQTIMKLTENLSPITPDEISNAHSCDKIRKLIDLLRKAYFITRGEKTHADAIGRLLSKLEQEDNYPQSSLYMASGDESQIEQLNSIPRELLTGKHEDTLDYAIKFYKGEINFQNEASLENEKEDERISKLKRMPATPQNVSTYVKFCFDESSYKIELAETRCAMYLENAPKAFRKAVVENILTDSKPHSSIQILKDLKVLELENGDEMLEKLIPQFFANWNEHPSISALGFLIDHAQYFSKELRDEIIDWIYEHDKKGDLLSLIFKQQNESDPRFQKLSQTLRSESISEFIRTLPYYKLLSSKPLTKEEETAAIQVAVPEYSNAHRDEYYKKLIYWSYRAYYDDGKKDFLNHLSSLPKQKDDFGDQLYQNNWIKSLIQDSKWAKTIGTTLDQSNRIKDFISALGMFQNRDDRSFYQGRPDNAFYFVHSLLQSDKNLFKKSVEAAVKLNAWTVISWCENELPEACPVIEKDSEVRRIRQLKLKQEKRSEKYLAQMKRFEENKETAFDILGYRLHPSRVTYGLDAQYIERHPSLMKMYQKQNKKQFKESEKDFSRGQMSRKGDEINLLLPQAESLIRYSEMNKGDILSFVRKHGSDKEKVATLGTALQTVIQSDPKLDIIADHPFGEDNDSKLEKMGFHPLEISRKRDQIDNIVTLAVNLDQSKAGREFFKAKPDLTKKITTYIKKLYVSTLGIALGESSLSENFTRHLRTDWPEVTAFKNQFNRIPEWLSYTIASDPEVLDTALKYMNEADKPEFERGLFSTAEDPSVAEMTIAGALRVLASKHDELVPKIRDSAINPKIKEMFGKMIP